MLLKLATATSIRLRELRSLARRDRGEGPVPYIIIVAMVAVAAALVAGAIYTYADGQIDNLNNVDTDLP